MESYSSDILSQETQMVLYENLDPDLNLNLLNNEFDSQDIMNGILNTPESQFNNIEDFKTQLLPVLMPLASNTLFTNEEYLGPYDFEVSVIPNGSKNPWLYSVDLNKLYMGMNSSFPVNFKIKERPTHELFIRVLPQYSQVQYAMEPVYRCVQHEHDRHPSNENIDRNIWPHVIRCLNGHSHYIGDKNLKHRLSIVIPFHVPQTGDDMVREMFTFVCMNTCPEPGMNRRSLEIIFTLEDINGQILGRKSMGVRICSCPKRDKEKDEKEFHSKNSNGIPRGKKRKVDKTQKKNTDSNNVDLEEYALNLKIVGKNNAQQVLKYCADLMSGEIVRNESNSNTVSVYKKCLDEINAKRDAFH